MSASTTDIWYRAVDSLRVAHHDLTVSPDAAASRAYYAAFNAVSAYFLLDDVSFSRHSAVEAAAHRELVKTGAWTAALGRGYSRLVQLRSRGDYGGGKHVLSDEAEEAIRIATDILASVADLAPDAFVLPSDLSSRG